MGAHASHVLALGFFSPADPLNGAGTFTSALIMYRAVEVRGRKLEFYRGMMATVFARNLVF